MSGFRLGHVHLPPGTAGREILLGDPGAEAGPRLAELVIAASMNEAGGPPSWQ